MLVSRTNQLVAACGVSATCSISKQRASQDRGRQLRFGLLAAIAARVSALTLATELPFEAGKWTLAKARRAQKVDENDIGKEVVGAAIAGPWPHLLPWRRSRLPSISRARQPVSIVDLGMVGRKTT